LPNHYELGYKYCSVCGRYLRTSARSCPICGTTLRLGPRKSRGKKPAIRVSDEFLREAAEVKVVVRHRGER